MHEDITDTLENLRAAGSDLRQNAELVEAVATVRVAQPDAKDSALDARCAATCAATNVMQEINLLQGIGSPLFRRPAVRTLNPP